MNELIKDITARELEQISSNITEGVGKIIEQSKGSIAVYLNSKVVLTYWNIGKYIAKEIDLVGEEKYGTKIVATVSQQLAVRYGKGYTRTAVSRMVKIARLYNDEKMVATVCAGSESADRSVPGLKASGAQRCRNDGWFDCVGRSFVAARYPVCLRTWFM